MKRGSHHTKETIQEMSRIHGGQVSSMRGKHQTKEAKRKISKALSGRKKTPFSEEHKRKLSLAQIGRKPTIGMSGKHHTNKAKTKISIAHKGKLYSEKTREKMSEAHKGEKSYLWRGGITSAIEKRLNSFHWKVLANKIRQRDNHWCLCCRDARGTDVHHMLPLRMGGTDDEINLVTLCQKCHHFIEKKIISKGKKDAVSIKNYSNKK